MILVVLGFPAVVYTAVTGNAGPMYRLGVWGTALGLRLAGIRVRTHGLEKVDPAKSYVFMANHQSHTDAPALVTHIPRQLRALLKKELGRIPILGRAMRLANFIFIDRGNRDSGRIAVESGARALQAGFSFMVFPEGTRSSDGTLGPFKSGSFVMAILAGVPVVPITLVGSRQRLPKGSLRLTAGVIDLYFHDPVPTAGYSTEDKLLVLARVRDAIASKL
ncbi:MAG: lysophospholipid acyltransferase family protein [Acidobacteriota bacterium]